MRDEATFQALLDAYTKRGHELLDAYRERDALKIERDAHKAEADRLRTGLWVEGDLLFGDDRDGMMAEIHHLRRGIEAYRANWKAANCCQGGCECGPDDEVDHEAQWADASDAVHDWEYQERERDEQKDPC